MRNREAWKATKFVFKNGKFVCTSDRKEVGVSSRLVATIVAGLYHRALTAHATGRLLDLGCGKVPLYAAYKDKVAEAVCVDWPNTLHKSEHLDQEVDLTDFLPFADGAFDTIILSDVLEHIPVPERLWNEMVRILRKDGKIIMNVPFYYWLHEQPYDYYRYTEFALRRFVDNSGMKLVELTAVGGAPEIIADILSKCAMNVPKIGVATASVIQRLSLWFVGTNFGKKASTKTSRAFPFGYFLVAEKP